MANRWRGQRAEVARRDAVIEANLRELRCRVPDDWLLHNRRGLLMGREVLRAVMAGSSVRGGVAC